MVVSTAAEDLSGIAYLLEYVWYLGNLINGVEIATPTSTATAYH